MLGLTRSRPGRSRPFGPEGRSCARGGVTVSGCPRTAGRAWRAFPVGAGPAWRGSAARGEARQGRAGTRVTGKRPSGSHGQVRNNLLEGDASFCTLQGSEVMFDGSQMFNRLVDSPVRNMYWQEVGVT